MDGVLWQDAAPIGDLPAIFAHMQARRLRLALATNNSTKTVEQYLEKLRRFGVRLEAWQIVTSALTLAHELEKRFAAAPTAGRVASAASVSRPAVGAGREIYTIGEIGLREALSERGFSVIDESNFPQARNILAVAVGMDRQFSFAQLRRAALLIRRGAPFYGTNPDRTFPTPEGLIPGAGALLAALEAATEVKPIVVGKPAAHMLELALERLGAQPGETLVVGDRLETDIAGGQALGCPTAVVLSGVTTRAMAQAWRPRVEVIAAHLAELVGG